MIARKAFQSEVRDNLQHNILNFGDQKMRDSRGGFYGRMMADGLINAEAPKGAILNARILWSCSGLAPNSERKYYNPQ